MAGLTDLIDFDDSPVELMEQPKENRVKISANVHSSPNLHLLNKSFLDIDESDPSTTITFPSPIDTVNSTSSNGPTESDNPSTSIARRRSQWEIFDN